MIHTILNAPYWQLISFLGRGDPPLIIKILAINTIFFMLFIVRRMRGVPTMRNNVAIRVQTMLIIANALFVFQQEIQTVFKYIL